MLRCKCCNIAVHTGSISKIYSNCYGITGAKNQGMKIAGTAEKKGIAANLPHYFVDVKVPWTRLKSSSCAHCGLPIKKGEDIHKCDSNSEMHNHICMCVTIIKIKAARKSITKNAQVWLQAIAECKI